MRTRRYHPGDRLRLLDLFAGCPPRELARIDRLFTDLVLADGYTLTRTGAVGTELFVLVAGTAVVTREGRAVARVGAGDAVGELALFDDAPRNADARAEGRIRVLVQGGSEFRLLLCLAPTVARRLEAVAARRRLPA